MNSNVMRIDSYTKDIAAAATPVNAMATTGSIWRYAKDVIVKAVRGNASELLVGNRDRQAFSLVAPASGPGAEEIRLSTIMNRMSQSGRFDLQEIYIKAGTNGDDVQIMLIDPSND